MILAELKGAAEFNEALGYLMSELNLPYQEVFPTEARLLAQEVMKRTPPFPKSTGVAGTNGSDAKQAGETTVGGDVERAQTPSKLIIKGQTTDKWLKKVIRKKDIEKINSAFQAIPSMRGWKVQPFNSENHKRLRGDTGKRYKVKHSSKIMTLEDSKYNAYKKEQQKKVGWMKAGWGISVQMLQGRVPAWISRNFGTAPGAMEMDVSDNNPRPYVKIWNDAPLIGRFAEAYEWAFKERIEAMGTKIEKVLEARLAKRFRNRQ